MRVYKENINHFNAFYRSDYYSYLKENEYDCVDKIFSSLYEDPDDCDASLYQELGRKFDLLARKNYLVEEVEGQKIRLAADIICGRKQLVDFRNNNYEEWIVDYERVRSNLNLHFLWPKHKAPTINTYRYSRYLDRIDCLLFDLKCYFEGQNTPMALVYQRETTVIWLKRFKNFSDFIDRMQLNAFVDTDYNVLDISKGQAEIIDRIYSRKEVKGTIETYIENMLQLNVEGKFI